MNSSMHDLTKAKEKVSESKNKPKYQRTRRRVLGLALHIILADSTGPRVSMSCYFKPRRTAGRTARCGSAPHQARCERSILLQKAE